MRTIVLSALLLLGPLLLASCASPPKPPTIDESSKRPVNTQAAVELQVCKNDLQNTRLLAVESGRLADATVATLANITSRHQALGAMKASSGQQAQPNSFLTVRFDFGSTRVVIPAESAAALIEDAKAAPLIVLRGRTDGVKDALVESRIARERASAVRDYLVTAGVDPSRIRATYQPVGDHVADNDSLVGRRFNRRVEIEVYHALPVALMGTSGTHP